MTDTGKETNAPDTLGRRLRGARAARGLTQMALAVVADTTLGTISELERDAYHGTPGLGLMRRLAAALGVTLEDLLGPNGAAWDASVAARTARAMGGGES